jgi:hypothetical protein
MSASYSEIKFSQLDFVIKANDVRENLYWPISFGGVQEEIIALSEGLVNCVSQLAKATFEEGKDLLQPQVPSRNGCQ